MSPFRLTIRQTAVLTACRYQNTHINGEMPNGVMRGLILRDMLCEVGPGEYLTTRKGIEALNRVRQHEMEIIAKWAEA